MPPPSRPGRVRRLDSRRYFAPPGAGGSPDKAALEEERKKNKQNVWFTTKVFVAYVALLRLAPYAYKALNG